MVYFKCLNVYQKYHNILCDGKLESIWKDYDKMSIEEGMV